MVTRPIGPEEIRRRVQMLEEFARDIRDHFDGAERDGLRAKISRSVHAVHEVVVEAGCLKVLTIVPPPMIGGLVQTNVDPFLHIFHDSYGESFIPRVIDTIEETIGVVQSAGYLERIAARKRGVEADALIRGLARVEVVCRRFPKVVRQLQVRHADRPTISIDDEYDVQDLLHALLRVDFDDIRHEEWTPSYAGGSARMDFLLKAEGIVIEVKKTRSGLGAKQVGDELLVDIARYQVHPDCRSLVCFIYDPDFKIGNPTGLETDLSRTASGLDVRIVIAPSER